MQVSAEITEAFESVATDLLARPGVTGVDIGHKEVGGRTTGVIAIRVLVAEKKDVPPQQAIPAFIGGVPTDVIERTFKPAADDGRYNPLQGGVSIGPSKTLPATVGTLGCLVQDSKTNAQMVLSNWHVLYGGKSEPGDNIVQPGGSIWGNDVVGRLDRGDLTDNGTVDCAVAKQEDLYPLSHRDRSDTVVDIGCLAGIRALTANDVPNTVVRKRGRTTGLTTGTVDAVHGRYKADYPGKGTITLVDQISIKPSPGTSFGDHGDSGSVVVDEQGRVVGLLWGVDTKEGYGSANHIGNVLSALNVGVSISGIGGYDLRDGRDQALAFDYNGTGSQDHLVLYRPGTGTVWILQRDDKDHGGMLLPVYRQDRGFTSSSEPSGISWDLGDSRDRIFAFDYNATGRLDHLVVYRPGTGLIRILQRAGNISSPDFPIVYGGGGIGMYDQRDYDLRDGRDRVFAFDYNSNGKQDFLVAYRPGTGTIWILTLVRNYNNLDSFMPVYQQGDPGYGIGGYNLRKDNDQVFAFDYDSSGRLDHLVLYRPGTGIIWILKKVSNDNSPDAFKAVYQQGDPGPCGTQDPWLSSKGAGIGHYDLLDERDRIFAFDYDGTGKLDHLVAYRPGAGAIFILKKVSNDNSPDAFQAVYQQGDGGAGMGGYDLRDNRDRILAFNYLEPPANLDRLILYRPGTGTVWLLQKDSGKNTYTPVYSAPGVARSSWV